MLTSPTSVPLEIAASTRRTQLSMPVAPCARSRYSCTSISISQIEANSDTPQWLSNCEPSARLSSTEHVELDVKGSQKDVLRALSDVEGVNEVTQTASHGRGLFSYVVTANPGTELRGQIASTVVGGGWDLMRLQSVGMSLEEIFLRLTTTEEGESAT